VGKAILKEGFIIELPKEAIKKASLKEGDWLVVRLLNGKEVVLEKKLKPQDVIRAIEEIRSGK